MNKIFTILKWIITLLPCKVHYTVCLRYWESTVNRWLATKGNLETIKRIKYIRLCVTKYLCGQPLHKSPLAGIGLNASGLPKTLGPMQTLADGDVWDKRFLLTLLSVSRVIPCSGTVSTTTISDPGKPVPETIIDHHLRVLKALEWKIDRPVWTKYHYSQKSGPNGQAMMGSIYDAHHLERNDIIDIYTLSGNKSLLENLLVITNNISPELWNDRFHFEDKRLQRKLSLVSDPEAKERVIAIFDYWSQTVLKPLHDSLIGFLRVIPGDCTYDHLGSSRFLPCTGPFYSMDLHAATDRYPVALQHRVLAELVGSTEYADAWLRIMTSKPFANPWGAPIFYGRGQPMGAYSSWAMFALCHHLTVRTAVDLAGLNPRDFTQYALLGDDIVLTNPRVAEKYQWLMEELGVELSPTKTHVSKDTYEFAKRWYQAGIEISGVQLKSLSTIEKWPTAAEELKQLCHRWNLSPLEMEPGSIPQFLKALGLRIRDTKKVIAFLHLPKKGDSVIDRATKYEYLATRFFPDMFNCFPRVSLREPMVHKTLTDVKFKYMEEGMKRIHSLNQGFLRDIEMGFAPGLVDQSVLLVLPPFAAGASLLDKLRDDYSRLQKAWDENTEDIILGTIASAQTDPSRITSVRANKRIIQADSSLVNKYSRWVSAYQEARTMLLSSAPLPALDGRYG